MLKKKQDAVSDRHGAIKVFLQKVSGFKVLFFALILFGAMVASAFSLFVLPNKADNKLLDTGESETAYAQDSATPVTIGANGVLVIHCTNPFGYTGFSGGSAAYEALGSIYVLTVRNPTTGTITGQLQIPLGIGIVFDFLAEISSYGSSTGWYVSHLTFNNSDYIPEIGGSISMNGTTYQYAAIVVTTAQSSPTTYTISSGAGTGGTISPDGSTSVTSGGSQTYTISANSGYLISDVIVDGDSKGAISKYTFSSVTSTHIIAAYFSKISIAYMITPSTTTGGTINYTDVETVTQGNSSRSYKATANPGYTFDYFKIDSGTSTTNPYQFTDVQASHTIEAHFKANVYNIKTLTATDVSIEGGTITPSTTITYGGSSVKISYSAYTGFTLSKVTINGTENSTAKSNGYYTVPSTVTSDQEIIAYFTGNKINIYTSVSPAGSGSITPSTTITHGGSSVRISYSANTGYTLSKVTINGTESSSAKSNGYYDVPSSVTSDQTIIAYFTVIQLKITASVGSGSGGISPSDITYVNYGGSQSYTISPSSGYYISYVTVTGSNKGAINSYDFSNVTSDQTITVYFSIYTYDIYAGIGQSGGSSYISPSGYVSVNWGGSQTFYMYPSTGYYVDYLYVDGGYVSARSSYTFSNVKESGHTIYVYFARY
ncbi:MAG: hypothetical protein LBT30_00005, partial [Clostridiales bacterium]|nr:hypothetical protein [Clostridiales bacterium]